MSRFVPTRSAATAVMAIGVVLLLALIVMLPFTRIRPMTVGYVAMLVTGVGMFLRERVFAVTPVVIEDRRAPARAELVAATRRWAGEV
jgi:hypothetical protein